jgi:hypothetical protein
MNTPETPGENMDLIERLQEKQAHARTAEEAEMWERMRIEAVCNSEGVEQ